MSLIPVQPSSKYGVANCAIALTFYTFANKYDLLPKSTLRIQILAFAVIARVISAQLNKPLSTNQTLKRVFTLLPLALNGLAACCTQTSPKAVLLTTTMLGGAQTLLLSVALYRQKKQIVDAVIQQISTALPTGFPRGAREIYTELLQNTQDINAQHDGWTLLHYCVHMFSHMSREMPSHPASLLASLAIMVPDVCQKGKALLDLIELLMRSGADLSKPDRQGRTPLYFASSDLAGDLNMRYWELIRMFPAVDSGNRKKQPLHVVASLDHKYVHGLVRLGARTCALDQDGRMPLHHAVIHSQWDDEFHNVKCLVEYAPQGIEHQDNLGNYPLFYAALFGSEELVAFLIAESSAYVILEVALKLKTVPPNQDHNATYNCIESIPSDFIQLFGGGRGKSNRKPNIDLEQIGSDKKKYHEGFPIFRDTHAYKHVIYEKAYESFKNPRDFIKSTKGDENAAMFLPSFANRKNMDDLIKMCVETWVAQKRPQHCCIQSKECLGGSRGKEAFAVMLYMNKDLGVHIRPINEDEFQQQMKKPGAHLPVEPLLGTKT